MCWSRSPLSKQLVFALLSGRRGPVLRPPRRCWSPVHACWRRSRNRPRGQDSPKPAPDRLRRPPRRRLRGPAILRRRSRLCRWTTSPTSKSTTKRVDLARYRLVFLQHVRGEDRDHYERLVLSAKNRRRRSARDRHFGLFRAVAAGAGQTPAGRERSPAFRLLRLVEGQLAADADLHQRDLFARAGQGAAAAGRRAPPHDLPPRLPRAGTFRRRGRLSPLVAEARLGRGRGARGRW